MQTTELIQEEVRANGNGKTSGESVALPSVATDCSELEAYYFAELDEEYIPPSLDEVDYAPEAHDELLEEWNGEFPLQGQVARQAKPAMTFEEALGLLRLGDDLSDAKDSMVIDARHHDRSLYDLIHPVILEGGEEQVEKKVLLAYYARSNRGYFLEEPYQQMAERIRSASRQGMVGSETAPESAGTATAIDPSEGQAEPTEHVYYEKSGRIYWVRSQEGEWVPVDVASLLLSHWH